MHKCVCERKRGGAGVKRERRGRERGREEEGGGEREGGREGVTLEGMFWVLLGLPGNWLSSTIESQSSLKRS